MYSPKSIINKEEHGDPFETIQEGLDWLVNQANKQGYQAQVTGNVTISGVTRYAISQVTQNTEINNISFDLKLVQGKRLAKASSTLIGEAGYKKLFDMVENNLKSSPEVSFYQGLPDPQDGEVVELGGKDWSIEARAEAVTRAVNAAEEIDPNVICAGTVTNNINYSHIVSTEGVDFEDASSGNYFKINSIVGPAEERGYGQEEINWRYNKPEIESMAKEATQTAVDTLELTTLEAQEYEVLLGPQAVSNLLIFILFSTDPTSFHESNSYASDKLGDQIFDEKLTIKDLPRNPEEATIVRSFDYEGVPTKDRDFIDNGVLTFIPYDSFFAAKYLDDPNMVTGHALTEGNPIPVSAVVEPGNKSFDDQISEIDNGLYIKNFWYNRFTKRREGGLTGLTRNGLYRIENGEITSAVRNLRYTESFVKAFGTDNIVSISQERRKYNLAHCPSIHLNAFNFSSIAHTKSAQE